MTQAELDALKSARSSGALLVEYGGKRVRFRNLAELDAIIASGERELAGTTKPSPVRRYRQAKSGW